MTETSTFVHLKVHSEYSLIDGLVRVKGLAKAVAEMGMPAVALTDQCNFYGLIKFYKAANGAGVKPIVGTDVWMKNDNGDVHTLTLLVQNLKGYKNLTVLISKAYREGQQHGVAYIRREWLKELGEGLIALSGGA